MVFALVATLTGFAQKTYEWKTQGVQVTLPEGFNMLENSDKDCVVGNGKTKIEIHIVEGNLDDITEDEVIAAIQKSAKTLNLDLTKSETKELECKNGYGIYTVAEHKTSDTIYGVISYIESNISDFYVCFAALADEEDAENIGFILGSFVFKK